jgi:molecular chaperone DnaK
MADGLVFNTEKQLKEYGDKIPAEQKATIEAAAAKLKEAHKAEDMAGIDAASEELNNAWQAASQHMYADQQQPGQGQPQQENAGGNDGNIADAEYEEVK